MGVSWFVNGGDSNYLLIGMILQVGDPKKTFTTFSWEGGVSHPMDSIPDAPVHVLEEVFLYLQKIMQLFLEPMYIGNTFIY